MPKIAAAMGPIVAMLTLAMPAADARGAHGFGHGHFGMHGSGGRAMHGSAEGAGDFADDKRHGNDAYTKAASEEEDHLLNNKIKSICRGC